MIAVAASMVRVCVAVRVESACDVAVTVTMLLVGTVAGAVYKPPLVIVPVPVPLTLQFTSVLFTPMGFAVHWEVVSTVTSRGEQETVIVGEVVPVELEPQDVTNASAPASPNKKNACFQCDFTVSKWSFNSDTRNPPARTTANFTRKA